MDVLLNVSVQMDTDKPVHLVEVNVFRFLLRVEVVDMAMELIQDATMVEDMSLQPLDEDVAVALDVDVEDDFQDVVQVDVSDTATVKPMHCSKTLAMLLVPDIRHTMDKPTCWMKALDKVLETKTWIKADVMTTVKSKETSAKKCIMEKNTKVKPAMTCVNLLMNMEPAASNCSASLRNSWTQPAVY